MPHQADTVPQGVAVTGLSCRFPGEGNSLKNFGNLSAGENVSPRAASVFQYCRACPLISAYIAAWSEIPKTRFDRRAFGHKIPLGAHFLKQDIAAFDGPFFSITAAEARAMDPQQRMMLEVVYEALESAGYPLHSLSGTKTGVFMGQLTSDYQELVCRDIDSVMDSKFSLTGLQRSACSLFSSSIFLSELWHYGSSPRVEWAGMRK